MSTSPEAPWESPLLSDSIIRPSVKPSDVSSIVKKIFGLTTISVKELNSYDDRNFHIKTELEINNPFIKELCPHGYVLKILNSKDSKDEKLVAAQNEMMLFLHSRGFNVPKPEKNIHGTHMMLEKIDTSTDNFIKNNVSGEPSKEYMVRLLTFLPGKILHQAPYTANIFFECGALTAKMNNALKEFRNEYIKSRKFIWMLENTPEISKCMDVVKNEKHKELVQEVLKSWNSNVVPAMPKLEKGMIHGDFNEQNIIVNAHPDDPTTFYVDGLLDFGDIHYSCYVFELAITIAYNMIDVKTMSPVDVGGHTLAGYFTQRKICETEWNILKECIGGRISQSLVIGAYTYEQNPGNEYLLITAKKGWDVLTEFWNTPKEEIISRWKDIVSSYQS